MDELDDLAAAGATVQAAWRPPPPKRKMPPAKRGLMGWVGAGAVVLVLFIIGVLMIRRMEAPPILMTPEALAEAYEKDGALADKCYQFRRIMVTGRVERIGTQSDRFVDLGVTRGYVGVQCRFVASQKETVRELTVGRTITVVGRCRGRFGQFVELEACKLE